jgi:hypothetical protein
MFMCVYLFVGLCWLYMRVLGVLQLNLLDFPLNKMMYIY